MLKAWDRHDRLTAITALTLSPDQRTFGLYFTLQRVNANADTFLYFLLELKRELGTPMTIIWDRLSAHRRCERYFRTCENDSTRFEYFPPYCPDLNPVEHVGCTTKWGRLANWPAPNLEALNQRVTEELQRQQGNQELLYNHFKWAKLKTEQVHSLRSNQ